jgi:hypothetical protein
VFFVLSELLCFRSEEEVLLSFLSDDEEVLLCFLSEVLLLLLLLLCFLIRSILLLLLLFVDVAFISCSEEGMDVLSKTLLLRTGVCAPPAAAAANAVVDDDVVIVVITCLVGVLGEMGDSPNGEGGVDVQLI